MASLDAVVKKFFSGRNESLAPTFRLIHKELGRKCELRVETIYFSYRHKNGMVAAGYPQNGQIELALSLPEDFESDSVRDAASLKWRMLPVSTVIADVEDAKRAIPLIREALRRVESGQHQVWLDNSRFYRKPKY